MKFEQIYSSSSGNLYMVTAANGKRLMIECGVTWSKLQKALNYDLSGIVGCLVSHEDQDHCKAIKEVVQAGIDVYMSLGTAEALKTTGRRIHCTTGAGKFHLSSFDVTFYNSNHDAKQPMLFVIKCDDEYILFATDTAYIKQRFLWRFSIIAIGCNYDKDILQRRVAAKDINEEVAKRLLTSHMEKQEVMRYLDEFCDLSKCREIHLLHMSGDNINKAQAKKDFEKRFFVEVIVK